MGFQLLLKLMTWCRLSDVTARVIGNLDLKQLQLRIVHKNPFHLTSDSVTLLHQNMRIFVGKSVMRIPNTFEYIGCYSSFISGLVMQSVRRRKTEPNFCWRPGSSHVLKCHWSSVPGGTSLAALHFLSTIYLGQLFQFAAVIYITFSPYGCSHEPSGNQMSASFLLPTFSVISSEKQILQLNELFWVCATIIK